jgi:SAM-dependent methyltransferase
MTNVGSDRAQLADMAKRAKATLESDGLDVIADRGYYSSEEILACENEGVTVTLPKSSWIPALDGVEAKLRKGGKGADVGCGHGASTILLAKAFPKSEFVGYDYHGPSIETATQRAKDAGVVNAKFEIADAASYRGKDFDLIAFFDCLHDMADPAGAARHARAALKSDGTCMLVEPFAGDEVADNLNPVGRMFYGASALVCVPVSLARNGPALGAQAGERRLREVMVDQGGFSTMRRASETPFNIILEARP